jgi:hypothetical protein
MRPVGKLAQEADAERRGPDVQLPGAQCPAASGASL